MTSRWHSLLKARSAPAVGGILLTWAVFTLLNPNFLSLQNLTNLSMQISAMAIISAGMVLVLLAGEIDLSAGAVSGLAAATMAVLLTRFALPAGVALAAGVVVAAAVGALHGVWITRSGAPAFVITLAGLLAWQGALLAVLGPTGSINLRDPWVLGLSNTFLTGTQAGAALVVSVGMGAWLGRRRANALWRLLGVAVAGAVGVAIMAGHRGVPSAVLIMLVTTVALHAFVQKTVWGRHILAVGSHADAARRAGINVARVRVLCFVMCSVCAGLGGLVAASRLQAVNQSSGSGDVLLNAVAAAVMGGTSLFGGRGWVWSAPLGALLIGSVSNGMDLLALPSSIKFMVTGAVLAAAVTVDAWGRRNAAP